MTLPIVRSALGLSQIELDRRAGVPKGTVHDIESGRNQRPSLSLCLSIANALREAGAKGVELEELFAESKVTR